MDFGRVSSSHFFVNIEVWIKKEGDGKHFFALTLGTVHVLMKPRRDAGFYFVILVNFLVPHK